MFENPKVVETALLRTLNRVVGEGVPISGQSNVFDLGLSSIRLAEFADEASSAIGRPVGLHDVFEAPSVERLASLLNGRREDDERVWRIEGVHPVTASQGARLERMRRSRVSGTYAWQGDSNVVTTAVDFDRTITTDVISDAVRVLVERHTLLRCKFHQEEDERYALMVGKHGIQLEDWSANPYQEALASLTKPFVFDTGPMARFRLVRIPGKLRVLIAVEHVVCDRYSLQILVRDLVDLCRPEGEPPDNVHQGAFSTKFAIAGHELGHLENEEAASPRGVRALSFWRDELGERSIWRPIQLNCMRQPARGQRERTFVRTAALDASTVATLRRFAATLQTSLTGVIAILLARSAVARGAGPESAVYAYRDNRWLPRLRDTVGPLITALTMPFSKLCSDDDQAADFCNAAFRFGTYPIDRLSADLDPGTWLKPSETPLLLLDVHEQPSWFHSVRQHIVVGARGSGVDGVPLGITITVEIGDRGAIVTQRHPFGLLDDYESASFFAEIVGRVSAL